MAQVPTTLTVEDIVNEIGIHTALTELDHKDYEAFTSSLLLFGKLDRATMVTAFQNENLKQQPSSNLQATALATASMKQNNSNAIATCSVCKKRGHVAEKSWIVHPELQLTQENETIIV